MLLADRICNDFPLFLRLFVSHFHSRTLNFVLEPDASFQMIVRFFRLFFIQYFYLMQFFSIIRVVYDGFIGSLDKLYNLYTSLIMRNIAWFKLIQTRNGRVTVTTSAYKFNNERPSFD